jgi:hypothetical protein
MTLFTEAKADLIGINGKFTEEFNKKILERKSNLELDHNCYQGSSHENLCEYAGRICYKSGFYGKKNRQSKEYHEHIINSKHHSIYGHSMLTFKFNNFSDYANFCVQFAGIPGWYPSKSKNGCYITINFRFIENMANKINPECEDIFKYIYKFFNFYAPNIFNKKEIISDSNSNFNIECVNDVSKLDPVHTWYTFEIVTSRRIAQELTRHSFQSAISMESSRYVPIMYNSLIVHPLLNQSIFYDKFMQLKELTDNLYKVIEDNIYCYLINLGRDNSFSKKQARGAATGSQLMSQSCSIVYSCSKFELENQIFKQRLNDSADMEINHLVSLMKKNFE